jgi:hypothetical protein
MLARSVVRTGNTSEDKGGIGMTPKKGEQLLDFNAY